MKPVTLKIQAFGSYAKETVIDFSKTTQNLFLVFGDTGAGKTTIFDAMVFALYAEARSGNNKKTGEELQSQFATIDVEPYVELSFMEKDDLYVVKRIPRHIRAKKNSRGSSNETMDKEKVSLIMPDLSEYPEKEADKKLEEIVGLTKPQFMQVAMIAQGEFMEMLRAKSDDKKEIFRKLFETGLYENIVKEFARRLSDKKSEMAQIRTICQTEVGHIMTTEDFEASKEIELAKKDFMGLEIFSVTKMELILQKLSELCEFLKLQLKEEKKANDILLKSWKEKNDNLKEGKQLLERFNELARAREALKELEERKEEIKELIKLGQDIQKAYEIKIEYNRYEDQNNLVKRLENNLAVKKEELPLIEAKLNEKQNKEKESKKIYDDKNAIYLSEKVKAQKALEIFEQLEEINFKKIKLDKDLASKSEAVVDRQREYDSFLIKEKEKQEELKQLKNVEAEYNTWQLRNKELEEMEKELEELKKATRDFDLQKAKVAKAKTTYLEATEMYEKANTQYESKRRVFLNHQAGILAGTLVEGEPCMVCGSKTHPAPYRVEALEEDISQEIINELQNNVESARKKQEEASSTSNKESALLEEKEKNLSEKLMGLTKRMNSLELNAVNEGMDYEEAGKIFSSFKAQVEDEGARVLKRKNELLEVEEFLKASGVKNEELTLFLENAKNEKVEIEKENSRCQETIKTLTAQLDYPSKEAAKDKEAKANKAMLEAKRIYDQEALELENVISKKQEATTLIESYEKELPEAKKEGNLRKNKYESILADYSMKEELWMEITREYSKTKIDEISQAVTIYNENRNKAEGEIASAKAATDNKEIPDIEALQLELEKVEEERKISSDKLSLLLNIQKTDEDVYKKLNSQFETRAAVIEETTRIEKLYKLLSGNVKGARMDIETYVQRVYLERILDAANVRFLEMSSGQFELRMYDLEKAGEGKNKGLDLMVYSNVTGKVREVRTLSGGESFMAALSLALGMADQIQENSGAISLDVMFIDEGFGSLDDHSRNQAIKVLKRMADTSKLIGIISHVAELKQEIDDLLIVEKDEKGSRVKWINS